MLVITFLISLLVFLLVGIISASKSKRKSSDYLLNNRETSAIFTALSGASTKYSGYMFIGLIGYIYTYGLSAIWIILGFLFGDLIAFILVQKSLRKAIQQTGALTYGDLISRWHAGEYKKLKHAIGLISLVFLSIYAAAQFNAGGKAFHAIFGWEHSLGTILGTAFVLSYCMIGGIRASIWTDVIQSIVMVLALSILMVVILDDVGGLSEWLKALTLVSPSYLDLGNERFGSLTAMLLFAAGWVFNGIGVIGQPHIMVRLMAMNPAESTKKAGGYYFLWSAVFLFLILVVGLSTRLFLNEAGTFDAELALPKIAENLLPEVLTGIILGGIFASIMSTTDSQILSCSAVLSEDFNISKSIFSKRLLTFTVTLISLGIALLASSNVFNLVIFAWSGLATAIAPIVLVHAFGYRPSEKLCLSMMAIGITTSFLWRQFGLSNAIYECLPGILASLFIFFINTKWLSKKTITPL